MSGGAIAGIVLGILAPVLIAIVIVVLVFVIRRRNCCVTAPCERNGNIQLKKYYAYMYIHTCNAKDELSHL